MVSDYVDTDDELVEEIREYGEEYAQLIDVSDNPEDCDMAMKGCDVVRIRMKRNRGIGYAFNDLMASRGFRQAFTDTTLTGSKYNPTRTLEVWFKRIPSERTYYDGKKALGVDDHRLVDNTEYGRRKKEESEATA